MAKLMCKFYYIGATGGRKVKVQNLFLQGLLINMEYGMLSSCYTNIKNVYVGIVIRRLEYVGHYQKRVGTT